MIYLDSTDPYWFYQSSKAETSKPTKKEDSIITNKMLILFGRTQLI